ncbi:uncharacterized protein LOC123553841 [Mercenaria mercenaria]|uniref:uncharacterized protein LOC123553841 n=1 Tax=Mercenaria mercenaria TaxID=6596 RepID=UPI00234E42FE|nr:uncharacterized protein LOC123553841 [Mercenaria mercenaria]
MDITGILRHDKERILNEDCTHIHEPHNNSTIRVKRVDLCSLTCAIISTLACIFACLCVIYCHIVLEEIRANHLNIEKFRISASRANIKAGVSNDNSKLVDYNSAGNNAFGDSDTDVYETEDFEDDKNNIAQLDSSLDLTAGLSSETFHFGEKKEQRVRRGTKEDIKACRKKCKGTGREKRKCKRACRKNAPTNVQGININSQINLPAAHFEANMRDEQTQILADTRYNQVKKEDEGPLQIFKQADWVKDSSPVYFSNDSVATTKSSGIFLVYAQAYIGGVEPEKSIIVVQQRDGKEVNALSCDNGVNSGHASEQMQTCSVFGLMKLEKGDTIEIQRSEATVGINLDVDKTFFGLVQLSGIAVK